MSSVVGSGKVLLWVGKPCGRCCCCFLLLLQALLLKVLVIQKRRGEGSLNVSAIDSSLVVLVIRVVGHVRVGQNVDPNVRLLLEHRIADLAVIVVHIVQIVVSIFHGVISLAMVPVLPTIHDGFDPKKECQQQFHKKSRKLFVASPPDNRLEGNNGFFCRECSGDWL